MLPPGCPRFSPPGYHPRSRRPWRGAFCSLWSDTPYTGWSVLTGDQTIERFFEWNLGLSLTASIENIAWAHLCIKGQGVCLLLLGKEVGVCPARRRWEVPGDLASVCPPPADGPRTPVRLPLGPRVLPLPAMPPLVPDGPQGRPSKWKNTKIYNGNIHSKFHFLFILKR